MGSELGHPAVLAKDRNPSRLGHNPEMNYLFDRLIPFALAAVAIVLLLGLGNMLRGGSPSRSQTLMRWRVALQFLAVIIIMTAIYLAGARP
jgi:hypothetical protein